MNDKTLQPLILLAEDNNSTQVMMVNMLKSKNYRVITATNGQQAIDMCFEYHPDIVLMDGAMPILDGFEACKQLKQACDKKTTNIPVIIVTTLDDEEAINKAFLAGAEDYAHKPVNWYILIHRIESLIKNAQVEKSLRHSEERFHTIFIEAPLGVAVIDSITGHIYDANPAYAQIAGRSIEDLKLLDWMEITHPDDIQKDLDNMADMNSGKTSGFTMEKRYIQPDGSVRWISMTIAPMKVRDKSKPRHLCMTADISLAKQQQKSLLHITHFDKLTKLPNRTLFADRFTQAIAYSKRTKSLLAVCFIDLDDFKAVNDVHGHDIGDKVLIEVTQRIKDNLREQDTASRLGGDEFVLLLGNVYSILECEQAMSRIHQALAKPYLIDDKKIVIAASSGITIYPHDCADPETILRHADSAMYQAKLSGRNRYHFFDSTHDLKVIKKHEKLNRIESAFLANEFCLFYQPKVNMLTGHVYGAEALIRWFHPEKGLIAPLAFLPYIEGTELEITVGNWVIDEALKQLNLWQEAGIDLQVSINISSRHIQWPGFYKQISLALSKYPNIQSKRVQLELLESSILSDITIISNVITQCCDILGLSIALDDFGTGYSSLTHLRRIPADTIKIDRSFISDMLVDKSDCAIVEGIIGLSKSFSRDVIAEGVETKEHGIKLMELDCIHAQGYGIARPMPADDIESWIDEYRTYSEWTGFVKDKK